MRLGPVMGHGDLSKLGSKSLLGPTLLHRALALVSAELAHWSAPFLLRFGSVAANLHGLQRPSWVASR